MATPECTEIWRPVKGYEGVYEVSDHGRVRSLDRIVIQWNPRARGLVPHTRRGRILKQNPVAGYLRVCLALNTHRDERLVHHLVLCAFVGEGEPWQECNHKDGNKHHNDSDNLEWATKAENKQHSIDVLGVKPWNRQPIDHTAIFALHQQGLSAKAIARHLQTNDRQIGRVLHGKHWQQTEAQQPTLLCAYEPFRQIGQTHWRSMVFDLAHLLSLRAQGLSNRAIARQCGVSHTVIADLFAGRHWSQRT